MTAYKHILSENNDGICRITLNQPEKRNPLALAAIEEILDALDDAGENDEVRVVIITGAGSAFSAGGDLDELRRSLSASAWANRKIGSLHAELHVRIRSMEKPVIAAVNGPATGGGCGLVAVCDLAIASDRAKFGTTEVNVGIFPMAILASMYRAIGRKKTVELAFTGAIIGAAEAERIGLVNRVVSHEHLEEHVMELAMRLASRSRVSISIGKTAVNLVEDMGFDQAMAYAIQTNSVLFSTEDVVEGTTAFVEKRAPIWRDR